MRRYDLIGPAMLEVHPVTHRVVLTVVLSALCGVNSTVAEETHDADWAAWKLPDMPHFRNQDHIHFPYPPNALRKGVQGRVLVAFDITSAGVARNVSVIWSENHLLEEGVKDALYYARFDVPADWASSSGAWVRWRLGFVYRLVPGNQSMEFALPQPTITVTATWIP
jgi:TonB family protein